MYVWGQGLADEAHQPQVQWVKGTSGERIQGIVLSASERRRKGEGFEIWGRRHAASLLRWLRESVQERLSWCNKRKLSSSAQWTQETVVSVLL